LLHPLRAPAAVRCGAVRRGAARRVRGSAAHRLSPAREVGYAPLCSSSIFPATNRTHPFIASIARADFSVCVRPSIRPLSLHDDSYTLPTIPYASSPSRSVRSTSLPTVLTPSMYSSRDPYPLIEATLAAIVVAAAAAAAAVVSAVRSSVDTNSTREIRRGSHREGG